MATWNSDNIILTKLGEQVLSKVQSGVGKLTVSRIVSGAGHVSPSKLYNQSQITDIKQELTIVKYTTTVSQSAISANLTNTGLEEAYDLYQIGIYVTHPDFEGEVLYLIAQCDSPDHIPLPGDNPVTLSYDLIMTHSGTKDVVINVSEAGHIDVTTFNEFADKTNTALNGKVSTSDFTKHINNTTAHVTPTEKKTWNGKANKGDIPTKLPADGGNADTVDGLHASDIQIDSVSDTAELVTLDNLQGGVPFSEIVVSGKNLIPYPYNITSGVYNGITIDISDDGKFSINGTATAGFTLITFANQDKPIKLVAGRVYTINCSEPYDINNFNLFFRIYHTDGTYSGVTSYPTTFIAKDGDYLVGSLWIKSGSVVNAENVEIQLELGTEATAYEPPIGSQEITLRACGKNLADLSGVDGKLISGISFAYDDGNVVLNGTSTATTTTYLGIKMHLSAGTYTVSGSMDKNVRVVLRNKSWVNIADSTAGATVTVTSDDYYVHIAITAGTVCDNVVIKPQLERGAVATEYEPYSGSTVIITPDSNLYTVPNDIRQQDGINNVSVSAGEVSIIGVKKSPVINRAWKELDSHTNNTTVHVTSEEKVAWNGKAELSDIPTTLPADGGNADTVDGKHASDFMPYIGAVTDLFTVNKTCICKYTSTTLNTPYKANLTTSATGLCIVNYEAGINHVVYFVSPAGSTDFYTAVTANGKIVANKNWRKVSDNGNAATINSKKINCNMYTDPVQFGKTANDTAGDIWKALPDSSIFMAGRSLFTDTSWAFPSDTATFTLVILKLTAQRTGGIYLYPKTTTGNIYHAVLDDDGNFKAVWYKINDGGAANTATKLATARTIDGMTFNGTASITHYAACSTAAATAAKVVSLSGFTLATGAKIAVKFTVTNTAANPTLNVNNTGAKAIYYRGAAISTGYLAANRTYEFIYNGTQYELVGDLDTNTDTKVTAVDNHYTPSGGTTTSASGGTLTDITNSSAGVQVVTGITKDAAGHVTGVTSVALKSTNTNTTYAVATTSANGLMSSSDKSKLDGIATGANAYTHPSYTARTGVPTVNVAPAFGGTFTVSQPVSDATGHITAINSRTITIPSTAASDSAAGLVSTGAQTFAGNKTFNGQVIPDGATAYGTPQARKLSSGTAEKNTTNCPSGAWYGRHS